jgi:protein-tyrosine-phosphatase
MGEYLLRQLAGARGLDIETKSCGVAAEHYFQVPEGVLRALSEQGINEVAHSPKLVTRELLDWADLVLVMAQCHREEVLDRFPEFRKKVQVFKTYAGRPGPADVPDPIGGPDTGYAACAAEIRAALQAWLV